MRDLYSELLRLASEAMVRSIDAQLTAHHAHKPKQWGNPEILRDRDGYPMSVHGDTIRIRWPQKWYVRDSIRAACHSS